MLLPPGCRRACAWRLVPRWSGQGAAMRLMAAKLTDTDFYGQIRTALAAKRLTGSTQCVARAVMSVYVRCAARLANYRRRTRLRYATPWRAILRVAGEFYKERAEGSGFVTLRRDKAYLCTRSGFVSLRRDKPKGRCNQGANSRRRARLRYATPWRAILRGKVAFCKANKRGSIPLYVTERFAAARREISRKIACLKYGIRR